MGKIIDLDKSRKQKSSKKVDTKYYIFTHKNEDGLKEVEIDDEKIVFHNDDQHVVDEFLMEQIKAHLAKTRKYMDALGYKALTMNRDGHLEMWPKD